MNAMNTSGKARSQGKVRRGLVTLLAVVNCFALSGGQEVLAAKPHGVAGVAVAFPPGPILPTPSPVPPQFDITGFIQAATLDTAGAVCTPAGNDLRLAGGSLTVNDINITVPCNTVLQMPATSLSWGDLFNAALTPVGTPLGQSGLALADGPYLPPLPIFTAPTVPPTTVTYNGQLPSYEVHVQGNIVNGIYIAGLIFISQQGANVGQGKINYIDYATATIHVGGPITSPPTPGANDVLVRFNDPIGRYGKAHAKVGGCATSGLPVGQCVEEVGYDPRFTSDTDNPTIRSVTGFPMCVPRFDPASATLDPACPFTNRPISAGPDALVPTCKSVPGPFRIVVQPAAGQACTTFMMDPPLTAGGTDPTQQAPFMVGDYISYAGTLKVDTTPLTGVGPFISAHTILDTVGIYTTPGVMPAYVAIDVMLAGTSALPIVNLPQETTSKVKIEGFTTDPTALVDIYAVDVDPVTGNSSDRLLATEDAGQPPVLGRYRFRPRAGAFLPPTREFRVTSRTLCGNNLVPCPVPAAPTQYANGLSAGQYRAPDFEFIFAENLTIGDPMLPANLQDLPFLFCGSGPLGVPDFMPAGTTSPTVGQLVPPPWGPPMSTPAFAAALCATATQLPAPGVLPPLATPDTVSIISAQWVNRNDRGKLNVIATSSVLGTTPGLQLYLQATALSADGTTVLQLAASPQPMSLVQNIPNTPAVCPVTPTNDPCWQYLTDGVLVDPASTAVFPATGAKSFVPPTQIIVTSTAGGTDTVPNAATVIRIR